MIQVLVKLAEKNGFLTYEQIEASLEDCGDRSAMRAILLELDLRNIELRRSNGASPSATRPALTDTGQTSRTNSNKRNATESSAIGSEDPVGLYFRQMAQVPLLTATDEVNLAKSIEKGVKARERLTSPDVMQKSARWRRHLRRMVFEGQCSREHLAQANTRLVVSIAKRYTGQGLPFSDLIQEGNVGLMRAVDKFDHTRGNRFSTYATWWIRQAITRALAQKTRTIRIPLHMTERIRQMYRASQDLEQQLGRRPTPDEIALHMGIEPKAVRTMMNASQHAIALEKPVGEDGDSEFGDFIEDRESASPADLATQNLLQETIAEVLAELTTRQSRILRLRFGLEGVEPHTLEEIANKFGLSRERIRQLEKEALRRLNNPGISHNLRDYLT